VLVTFAEATATVWKRSGGTWLARHRFNVAPNAEAVLSPDEEYLIVPNWPRHLRIYRVRDGLLVNELDDNAAEIVGITFSRSGDKMAIASWDSSIRVYEFPSCKLLHCFLGHAGRAWHVAWSPTDDAIASVGSDGTMRTWDVRHGSSRLHLKLPTEGLPAGAGIWDFAYLKDGQHINGTYKQYNFIWSVGTETAVPPEFVPGDRLKTPTSMIQTAALRFPSESFALLPQWDPKASFPTSYLFDGPDGLPASTRSCKRLVAEGFQLIEIADRILRRWNLYPLRLVEERSTDQHKAPELVFDISPDGTRVCGGTNEGSVDIYDWKNGTAVRLKGISEASKARFSSDGRRVLVLSGRAYEYDAATGERVQEYGHERANAANFSADNQRVAVSSELGYVVVYDTVTGQETLRLDGSALALLFASDGTSLLGNGAPEGGLWLWPGKTAANEP
jgi:WD40 repeat protein